MVAEALVYLAKGDGGRVAKHGGPTHAAVFACLFYVVVLGAGVLADCGVEAVARTPRDTQLPPSPVAIVVFVAYWALLFGSRLAWAPSDCAKTIYELAWSCTAGLLSAALALCLRRAGLLCAAGLMVAIDQALWLVDIIGYLALGKMPVKVCGYLFWPSTTLAKKVTAMHHVVFIPATLFLCARGDSGIPLGRALLVVAVQTVACQAICRFATPLELPPPRGVPGSSRTSEAPVYLNLNLCYESFPGVKVEWIRRFDRGPAHVYLPWMLWIWNLGNFLSFVTMAAVFLPVAHVFGLPGAYIAF